MRRSFYVVILSRMQVLKRFSTRCFWMRANISNVLLKEHLAFTLAFSLITDPLFAAVYQCAADPETTTLKTRPLHLARHSVIANGNSLPTFRDNLSVPYSRVIPLLAAYDTVCVRVCVFDNRNPVHCTFTKNDVTIKRPCVALYLCSATKQDSFASRIKYETGMCNSDVR
jgi:hypothetical protein